MRGKGRTTRPAPARARITPAYAGKRPPRRTGRCAGWDHPRMCGEKPTLRCPCLPYRGSPPRMRGKGIVNVFVSEKLRITPACAGKSWSNALPCSRREDHPRMCGEKLAVAHLNRQGVGITPACAGKSARSFAGVWPWRDHPRMCGEKTFGLKA